MSPNSAFKVIVVGGGPVGLTAAHAFSRAGIPFTLLERRESAIIDAGSNLVLSEIGMRALAQLGLLSHLDNVTSELKTIHRIDHSGKDMGDVNYFKRHREQFGIWPRVLSRHDLTDVLYSNLSDSAKSSIHTSKKVTAINTTSSGATVTCSDGTTYEGTIVIGADGAHSIVRSQMRTLALEANSTEVNAEQPFLTTYRCIWIRFPTNASPLLKDGLTSETHGEGAATQLFAGEETGVTGIYERLPEPTKERIRYTEKDEEDIIERWGHLPLLKGSDGVKDFTIADAHKSRVSSGLVSLEEGVVDHWSFDSRIVLVGDASHKFTPSTGSGCNNGIIDIVALSNQLHAITTTTPGPTRSQIAAAFKAYQASRYDSTVSACEESCSVTNMATWGTGVHKFLDQYVIGFGAVHKLLTYLSASKVARTPRFNFISGKECFEGTVAWKSALTPTVQA